MGVDLAVLVQNMSINERSNAVSINQNCASGMRALEIACNNILLGKTEVGLVIGTENMTQAPYMLPKARMGYRMGDIPTGGSGELYDSLIHDALYDEMVPGHMGVTADNVAKLCRVSRQECDELAVMSHNRACAAIDSGKFKDEIVPVVLHDKRKGDITIDTDEHPIRDCSYEKLAKMHPVFSDDGVTTAANASGINDAAAAVVIMSGEKAKELGIKPLAKLLDICGVGVAPKYMGIGPAYAIPRCLKNAGLSFDEVDYWEINEAFAAQFLGVARKLEEEHGWKLNMDCVNRNGSGISLGHPLGCTGLRIIVSMLYEMERQGNQIGCASLCVGGGPAMASLWSRDID